MTKHKDNLVSLSVRVTPDMADELKLVADAADRPVAAEIRRLIRVRLDEADREAA